MKTSIRSSMAKSLADLLMVSPVTGNQLGFWNVGNNSEGDLCIGLGDPGGTEYWILKTEMTEASEFEVKALKSSPPPSRPSRLGGSTSSHCSPITDLIPPPGGPLRAPLRWRPCRSAPFSALLSTHLEESLPHPYRPGRHDCITFIARWADLIAGTTHTRDLQDTYHTLFQGLRKHVTTTISAAIEAKLLADGWHPVPLDRLQTGDIILTDLHQPGIWDGHTIVTQLTGAAGRAHLHHTHATHALRWPSSNNQYPIINPQS